MVTGAEDALIDNVETRKQQLSNMGTHGSKLKSDDEPELGFIDSGGANKAIDTHNKMDNVYQHDENAGVTVIITREIPGCDDD